MSSRPPAPGSGETRAFNYTCAGNKRFDLTLVIGGINLQFTDAHLFVSIRRSEGLGLDTRVSSSPSREEARARSASSFCREPKVQVGRFYRTGHSCARCVRLSVRPSLTRLLYFAFRDTRAVSAHCILYRVLHFSPLIDVHRSIVLRSIRFPIRPLSPACEE